MMMMITKKKQSQSGLVLRVLYLDLGVSGSNTHFAQSSFTDLRPVILSQLNLALYGGCEDKTEQERTVL